MLDQIKDNYPVDLKRESISKFLAKAFEFLLNFDLNVGICTHLTYILNKLKFRAFNLDYVKEMFRITGARLVFIIKAFDRSVSQLSDSKIGQDPKNFIVKNILKLLSKINYVFKDDFAAIYKHADDNNLTYLDENGVQFSYYFMPAKFLNKQDLDTIMNEIMFFRSCDIKMRSTATVCFTVRAVKNKHFACSNEVLERIFYDVSNLAVEIGVKKIADAEMYMEFMGYILGHISFSRANSPSEFQTAVARLKGYLESIVDQFHPMSTLTNKLMYSRRVFSNFVFIFKRQFLKHSRSKKIDVEHIRTELFPVIKKIMRFAILGKPWKGFDETLMDLCNLDQQEFVCGFLETMKEGLELPGLAESCVLISLRNISPFLRGTHASQFIKPFVTKLMEILENSDEDTVKIVGKNLTPGVEGFGQHLPQLHQDRRDPGHAPVQSQTLHRRRRSEVRGVLLQESRHIHSERPPPQSPFGCE